MPEVTPCSSICTGGFSSVSPDEFLEACERNSSVLWKMLRAGADVNTANVHGDSGLILASRSELGKSTVSTLLTHNSDKDNSPKKISFRADNGDLFKDTVVNINQVNYDGQTALMVAAGKGHTDIVKLLIDHKGVQKLDVNVRDIDNKTALHYAVISGSPSCFELLLGVRGIDIDEDLEQYATGNERKSLAKMVVDARVKVWKKTKDFENIVFKACNGDLCKLPEPWEPNYVQVKKSMDLIQVMSCAKLDILVQFNEGRIPEVKWLEYPEQIIYDNINYLLSYYQADAPPAASHANLLGKLQEKLVTNSPPNLQYFLNVNLVKLMKNPGGMTPSFFDGDGFDVKEILSSMTSSERECLIRGMAKMSDNLPIYPSDKFNQAVKFFIHGVDRALGLPWEFNNIERQAHFHFCNNVQNRFQDAFDINETYWEKISNSSSKDQAECCQTEDFDRNGCVLNAYFDYILDKIETLAQMGRLEEARELCYRVLKDLREKTVYIRKGKKIRLSTNEVKSDLGLVIESLYVRLASISVHENDFLKAFEVLRQNVFELSDVRLETTSNIHKKLKQDMADTNHIAKESLEEDFKNSKIIVNPFLDNHYVDRNGKIFVESLDKAVKVAKNGDSIFLKNGEYNLDQKLEGVHVLTNLDKNVTIIGESTNKTRLHLYLFKCTNGEVRFKRLHIKVGLTISISEGKMSFESCLIDVSCDSCFTFENRQAEIDLFLCCVTNRNDTSDAMTTLVLLKNPDPTVKMKFRNCFFSEFLNIIRDPVEMSLRCGFDLHVDSCSFLGIKLAMIALCPPYGKEYDLTYPTSVVIRNCFVEISSSTADMFLIMNLNNASHVIIESSKFTVKRGDPATVEMDKRIYSGLTFAYIKCVEIINTKIVWEGKYSGLANLQTYLEKPPKVGLAPERDAAIQLMGVHEAIIRDSTFKGFYCGINTESVYRAVNKICFAGVYNCRFANMAVCVFLESRFTRKSIFVLSDISFVDSLVAVRISEMSCYNGLVDVLDAKFRNVVTPIVLPKILKQDTACVKDENGNVLSSLNLQNLTFTEGAGMNESRKKRRDNMIANLMKSGVLDPTVSLPYLETIFKPRGGWLEIANEKDLELFNFQESRPSSTSDYHSDSEESVD